MPTTWPRLSGPIGTYATHGGSGHHATGYYPSPAPSRRTPKKRATLSGSGRIVTKETTVGGIGKKVISVMHMCSVCGKEFQTQSGLWKHASQHTGKFSYNCDLCEKGFNDRDRFEAHKNHHLGAGFACMKCSKTFFSQASMAAHMKKCEFFVQKQDK